MPELHHKLALAIKRSTLHGAVVTILVSRACIAIARSEFALLSPPYRHLSRTWNKWRARSTLQSVPRTTSELSATFEMNTQKLRREKQRHKSTRQSGSRSLQRVFAKDIFLQLFKNSGS